MTGTAQLTVAEFAFCPALPGGWSRASRDFSLVNEESAHAVVAALVSLRIYEARIDRPDVDVGGQVSIAGLGTEQVECEEDIRRASYRRLLAVLAGPVFVGRWDTGRWPLDRNDPGDVGLVARCCWWLGYDVVDLFLAERRVKALLKDKQVHQAIKAVGTALLEQGAIRGSRVSELVAEARVDPAVVTQALSPLRSPGV